MPAQQAKAPFVVMAKPVGSLCNMRCEYCYYLETQYPQESAQSRQMTDETLERFIGDYMSSDPGEVIPFTWHGGEPTISGIDFYKNAIRLQQKYLPEGKSCWNNLQTNGLLLDDEWCAFLAENKFDVGLSLDGTGWLHDAFRKDRAGQGTYDRVYRAAQRLKAHGVLPDLLCTVTEQSAQEPLAVYRALRALGTGWIQFIPIIRRAPDGGATADSVTGESYGKFLCAVFDEWLLHDLGRTNVQLFAEMAAVWAGGEASLCWMAPTCGRVLIVEKDGGVYSCDHFVDVEHRIGNIGDTSLAVLADLPEQERFGMAKKDTLPSRCRACRFLNVCGGGCVKDRFLTDKNGEEGLNWLCAGLFSLFEHAEGPLRQVIEQTRQGRTPEQISQTFLAKAQLLWKGVGRNDPCPCGSGRKAKNCCWDKRP